MEKLTKTEEQSPGEARSNKSWFGVVFGLAFLLSGLFAAYFSAGSLIINYMKTSSWELVPAEIQQVKLVQNYGSDSTTYKVTGSYQYQYFGQSYTSNSISLSKGSDNLGSYWQDLYSSLKRQQNNGTAQAWVNPDKPNESYLDRTFRWSSIIFGGMFLLIFGGVGGVVTWASLRGSKSSKQRIKDEQTSGVTSDQKYGSWALAGFGGIFFVMGAGMSALMLPDELAKGNYAALLILLFVAVGAGILYYALKVGRAYRRFGPTPLFLSPVQPRVGGQLGGKFTIALPALALRVDATEALEARLSCSHKRKSGDDTRTSIAWQSTAPVYLERRANGLEGRFLFDIPEDVSATREWSNNSAVEWSVNVEGDFSKQGYGEFSRDWEVVIKERGSEEYGNAEASSIHIPQTFLDAAEVQASEKARLNALSNFPFDESTRYLEVISESGRYVGTCLGGILFGLIFAGIGLFTIEQDWWPGYIFVFLGGLIGLLSLFTLGREIELKIDKQARMLYTRRSWFGIVLSKKEAAIFKPEQFESKKTSSSQTGNELTEYFALYFHANGKKIKIAEGIEGKRASDALKREILDRCFD